jgi:hypothetical protein
MKKLVYILMATVIIMSAYSGWSMVTVHMSKAGTLSDSLPGWRNDAYSPKPKYRSVRVTGGINNTDFRVLRYLGGDDTTGGSGVSKYKVSIKYLDTLDLSEAQFVTGGGYFRRDTITYRHMNQFGYIITDSTVIYNRCLKKDTLVARAFDECVVRNLVLPHSIKYIDTDDALPTVMNSFRLPRDMKYIPEALNRNDFSYGSYNIRPDYNGDLEYLTVDSGNPCFSDTLGSIYSKDRHKLCIVPNYLRAKYKFPSATRVIGSNAFCNRVIAFRLHVGDPDLTFDSVLTIPEGIDTIEDYGLKESNYTQINFPSRKIYIGKGAFRKSYLRRITLPDWMTEIPDESFAECRELKLDVLPKVRKIGKKAFQLVLYDLHRESIKIDEGVEEIADSAFMFAFIYKRDSTYLMLPKTLKRLGSTNFVLGYTNHHISNLVVYCWATVPPACSDSAFFTDEFPDTLPTTLYVPKGCGQIYASTYPWSKFRTILETDPENPSGPAGQISVVRSEADNAEEIARYDISGMRLSTPRRGLNIVRYSDGTVRKEIVK